MDGLAELLGALRADPDAAGRFRQLYTGTADALDVLAWRLDRAAVGPTGAASPAAEQRVLEHVVHARPAGPEGERERDEATATLRALVERTAADDAALDVAIARYAASSATQPEDPVSSMLLATAQPLSPWARRAGWLATAAGVLIAGGLLIGAVQGSQCTNAQGCAVAEPPTATPSTSSPEASEPVVYDALWDFYMHDYPDAIKPDVPMVQFVTAAESTPALVSCLNAAGFPEAHVEGGDAMSYGPLPDALKEGFNLALYTCRLQYPLDPLAVFDRPQTDEEIAYEAKSPVRGENIDLGTGRLVAVGAKYQVLAYKFTSPSDPPFVCAVITFDAKHTSSGDCVTVDEFRLNGLRPSGLIWSPNGDIELTAYSH